MQQEKRILIMAMISFPTPAGEILLPTVANFTKMTDGRIRIDRLSTTMEAGAKRNEDAHDIEEKYGKDVAFGNIFDWHDWGPGQFVNIDELPALENVLSIYAHDWINSAMSGKLEVAQDDIDVQLCLPVGNISSLF